MANTVTVQPALTIRPRGAFAGQRITPYRINLGTVDTVFEVVPKQTGRVIYLVGWEGVGSDDNAVTFYTASTLGGLDQNADIIIPYMFGANSGRVESLDPTHPKILLNTDIGEGLFMKGSLAAWYRFYIIQG